jgi:uncharacterized protein YqgC (DUF456 family)
VFLGLTLPGLAASVILLLMLVALITVPVGLPGVWIMIGLAALLALGGSIAWTTWLVLLAVAAVAEVGEFAIMAKVGKRFGGSRKAFWGALVGGFAGLFVGTPVPVVGSVLMAFAGSFVGAALVTVFEGRGVGDAGRVGTGILLARILAVGLKVAAGMAVIAITGAALLVR